MKIRTRLKFDSFNTDPDFIDIERNGECLEITFDAIGSAGGFKPRSIGLDADELERIMVMLFPERQ